jgi:DNA-binding transcriptional LysR family regulator
MNDLDWDDLRHVLALVQHQTASAAALALRVHQTTLTRRIAALERRLDTPLFDRSGSRLLPTRQGMVVFRRAQEMDAASRALRDDLSHDPDQGPAVVRLSAIQTFVTGFLFRHLPAFPERFPDIQLELICENRDSVLEQREADIAVRYVRPAQGPATVRKIAELGSAAYAHKSLLRSGADWQKQLPWIGFAQVADRWPEFEWIAGNVPREHVAITVNGGPAYSEVVARGNGVGIMTCVEGDARPELRRLSGPKPLVVREIWLLVLPEQRRNSAVRKVLDWLISVTRREAGLLLGASTLGRNAFFAPE